MEITDHSRTLMSVLNLRGYVPYHCVVPFVSSYFARALHITVHECSMNLKPNEYTHMFPQKCYQSNHG